MRTTGRKIAETTLIAYTCHGGYIWGKRGETWTQAKQDALKKTYNSNPQKYADYKASVQYGEKWIGHRVWDCSGLTDWAAEQNDIPEYHHGSNSMYLYDMAYKGELKKGMELPIGAYVYTGNNDKKPHIGTYTGDGLVTEAAGSNAGVIQTKLHGGKWKYWGLGKYVEYEFIPGGGTNTADTGEKDMRTLKKGCKGEDVRELQQKLLDRGYALPRFGADGDYGNETMNAVKAFQRDWGLKVDGIAGPETMKMLNSTPEKPANLKYTATIKGLTGEQARELKDKYPGCEIQEE